MEKEPFDFVMNRTSVLAKSDASTQVTKDAALAWQRAVSVEDDGVTFEEATAKLLDALEGRPTTIDGVIAFAQGPAKDLLGEEAAARLLESQLKRKEQGAKYCNCEACSAATEILAKFGRIEL